jgi:hypothetical protein
MNTEDVIKLHARILFLYKHILRVEHTADDSIELWLSSCEAFALIERIDNDKMVVVATHAQL